MAELEDSIEDFQLKLDEYRQNLLAVQAEIERSGPIEDLLNLESDLKDVILLTEDLIKHKQSSDLAGIGESAHYIDKYEPAQELPGDLPSHHQADLKLTRFAHIIGRTCQAPYKGKPFYGIILAVQNDPRLGESALVEFIGYGNQELCPLKYIQLLVPPSESLCRPGSRVQALFSEDGRWYNCQINEQTGKGFHVTYTDYGNSEEVPADRIRLSTAQIKEATKSKIKEIITPGGYRIPEYLTVKPNDSDSQKLNKRKKIQLIKKKQKDEQANEEAQTRASSWRKFNNKAINKKVSGFISGRGHQSIFKSNDTQASTTVQPLTQGFVPRRRYDGAELGEV